MKATETNGVLMNERAPTKVLGFMVQGGDYTADVLMCPLFEALQNKFVRGGVLRVHKFQLCCLQACGWFFLQVVVLDFCHVVHFPVCRSLFFDFICGVFR